FAPYTTLDDYLLEIARTWRLFVDLVAPVAVVQIRLRFINRIPLPMGEGPPDLNEYLKPGPKLPEGLSLELTSILNQYTAIDAATGDEVNVRIVIDEHEMPPKLSKKRSLPVIFDVAGLHRDSADPQVWENIEATILALRGMVSAVFWSSLTERCLNLFR
ncbi:MAG: TIGR04255 family protein, partial [Thermoanaerobaculia bacterium]